MSGTLNARIQSAFRGLRNNDKYENKEIIKYLLAAMYKKDKDSDYYTAHLLNAWEIRQDMPAEEKAHNYMLFLVDALPFIDEKKQNIFFLDQLSNLYRVMNAAEGARIKESYVGERLHKFEKKRCATPDIIELFYHMTILSNCETYDSMGHNHVNQAFVNSFLAFNNHPELEELTLSVWSLANALYAKDAVYSMLSIECAYPHSFSDTNIKDMKRITEKFKDIVQDEIFQSMQYELLLLDYKRNGHGLTELQEMYEKHPKMHDIFNELLEKTNVNISSDSFSMNM